ncbi:unnamed protein product [Parnassius apollo]|uniref:(apollo) hypothetical protein n=1 Tax=Parnassius apollo TaxID=110799 RepID=A0A8S3YGN4_PARAO|nr:unnamed protein product [Parnassius apollo]
MTDSTEVEVTYVSQRNKRKREEADENSSDILIGRVLLALGFSVHISSNKLTIIEKSSLVNICDVGKAVTDFDNVDTDITNNLKPQLMKLLGCFTDSFVEGTPTSRVKTGELEIKLIVPCKIVQRRPYCLNAEERCLNGEVALDGADIDCLNGEVALDGADIDCLNGDVALDGADIDCLNGEVALDGADIDCLNGEVALDGADIDCLNGEVALDGADIDCLNGEVALDGADIVCLNGEVAI